MTQYTDPATKKLIRDHAEIIRIRGDDLTEPKVTLCTIDISMDRAMHAAERIVYEMKRGNIDGLRS